MHDDVAMVGRKKLCPRRNLNGLRGPLVMQLSVADQIQLWRSSDTPAADS
jgi:hypothetical protein